MREKEMVKGTQNSIFIFICFALVLFGPSISSFAQNKAKLYAEIAGDYEYEFEGQAIIIIYSVEDGVLYGNTKGNPEPPSLLEFETTGSDGNLYVISFSRDEGGKITRSLLSTQGMEIEGIKIKKQST